MSGAHLQLKDRRAIRSGNDVCLGIFLAHRFTILLRSNPPDTGQDKGGAGRVSNYTLDRRGAEAPSLAGCPGRSHDDEFRVFLLRLGQDFLMGFAQAHAQSGQPAVFKEEFGHRPQSVFVFVAQLVQDAGFQPEDIQIHHVKQRGMNRDVARQIFDETQRIAVAAPQIHGDQYAFGVHEGVFLSRSAVAQKKQGHQPHPEQAGAKQQPSHEPVCAIGYFTMKPDPGAINDPSHA